VKEDLSGGYSGRESLSPSLERWTDRDSVGTLDLEASPASGAKGGRHEHKYWARHRQGKGKERKARRAFLPRTGKVGRHVWAVRLIISRPRFSRGLALSDAMHRRCTGHCARNWIAGPVPRLVGIDEEPSTPTAMVASSGRRSLTSPRGDRGALS
jgi:hypothetical protein